MTESRQGSKKNRGGCSRTKARWLTHVSVFGTRFVGFVAKQENVLYNLVTSSICDTMCGHLSPMGILQFRAIRDAVTKTTTNRTTLQGAALCNSWVLYGL